MSVVVRRITYLSMDKDDERVYPTKLLTGDIAKLFKSFDIISRSDMCLNYFG